MFYNPLLFLTKKFADIGSDYFKKPISTPSEDEELLIKHKIYPIMLGRSGTSFINSGKYSNVYRVLFKGKEVVAKITGSSIDVKNIVRINNLKSIIPNKFKKHVPTVYGSIYDEEENKYIVLVEILKPLNIHVFDTLKGEKPKRILFPLIKPEKLKEILSNIFYNQSNFVSVLGENFNDFISKLSKLISDYLLKYKDFEFQSEEESGNAIEIISNNFVKLIYSLLNTFKYIKLYQKNKSVLDSEILDVEFSFYKFLTEALSKTLYFPKTFDELIDSDFLYGFNPYDYMPETKSLLEFLRYLNHVFKIKYEDLHLNNLMQRPSTGDIVISDPGNFEIF